MDSGNHCAMREKGEISWCLMPLLQTRQVRTGLPCHGCHGCVAMRCCISLATFHQTSSDCSIFQAKLQGICSWKLAGSFFPTHIATRSFKARPEDAKGRAADCTSEAAWYAHTHTQTHTCTAWNWLLAIPLYLNLPAILATGSTKVQTNMLEQDLQEHMHTSSASSSPFVTLLFICYSCNTPPTQWRNVRCACEYSNKILYV